MLTLVVRRMLQGILVVFVAASTAFLLIHLAPGDPFSSSLESATLAPSVRERLLRSYGLDRPLPEQYVRWLANVARGDLGWSTQANRSVVAVLGDALPNTLLLVGSALVLGFGAGILAGVAQATLRVRGTAGGRRVDRTLGAVTTFFFSVPEFWLALALLLTFALAIPLFPAGGVTTAFGYEYMSLGERLLDRARHLALPAIALALGMLAVVARHQRAALLEVAREDFLRTARAKGVPDREVMLRHALRNALIPIITLLGLAIPALVGGVVFVEQVFSWPGMGRVAVEAVSRRDYAVVTGSVIVGSVAVTIGALLAEVLLLVADPRLRDAAADRPVATAR